MRIAQCDSWTRNRSPLDPINTRPTGRTDRCAGQYVLLVCLHIRVDQNIGRLCWLFGPYTGTFEQISRPDISVLSKNSAASLDAALCFRFETKAFCSIVCPGKQLVTDAHLRMGLTQHTVRTSVHWVLEQFQRLMAVLVRVRLWDRISLPTKHTKIGHFSVLHENTLRAAHAIFLLHRHDCAISRIGF